MSCWEVIADYGLRSIGIGERLLPRTDFTLCQQVVLIGSGLIWNIYFGVLALGLGFFMATAVALGKAAASPFNPRMIAVLTVMRSSRPSAGATVCSRILRPCLRENSARLNNWPRSSVGRPLRLDATSDASAAQRRLFM